VRKVMDQIHADMRMIVQQTAFWTQAYADTVMGDIIRFAEKGYLDRVRIRLVGASGKNARVADYKVNEDVSDWSSDRAGGNLSNVSATRMNVTLDYTDKWRALTAEQQATFRKALAIGWTSETDDLSVDHLKISGQRTYVSNGYGVKMSAPAAFELVVDLPDEAFDKETGTLLGFEPRYARVEKQLKLLSDPDGLRRWASDKYKGKMPPIFDLVGGQYPLFVLAGDVGTGKTVFAKCSASRMCNALKREGHFFALSTRVRGSGRVGEASTRINEAFDYITSQLGKNRLVFLLIDEADSLLAARSDEHNHLEDRVAVNTIIQKVDDLRRHGGRLVVFLATNRIDTLDPAILRRIAMHETFERPNDGERLELLTRDLAALGLTEAVIRAAAEQTGPQNGAPGFTYSDFRTRLLPRIVANAYPGRAISAADVADAVATVKPSPSIK
jgi:hypothetical protein